MGEHDHGLYAMPSFVDEKALTIRTWPLLLEGPQHELPQHHQQAAQEDPLNIPLPKDNSRGSTLVFGESNQMLSFIGRVYILIGHHGQFDVKI